jgi:tRNA-Thr(GGU) m(6)t(6)A37 methyltransferase TsaA
MMDIQVIGVIHTPFARAEGTPIQSAVAAGAEGRVEVHHAFTAGLKDLDGFERIWLLYWFDRAAAARLRVVPYLDQVERGVFATRAPCRPNPIGLSSVRLLRVEGNVLHVRDVDMLDGTPLIDIKPYAPRFDRFEVSRCGWLDAADAGRRLADERFSSGHET